MQLTLACAEHNAGAQEKTSFIRNHMWTAVGVLTGVYESVGNQPEARKWRATQIFVKWSALCLRASTLKWKNEDLITACQSV